MVGYSHAFVNVPKSVTFVDSSVRSLPMYSMMTLNMIGSNYTTSAIDDGENEGVRLMKSPLKKKMPHHDDGGPVQPIRSVDEFLDAIGSAPKNSLVVVQ